eukprot:TRINITY_DN2334_c0_g1_i3.p1 TRINITY_DN2334_c0_g1~~TRINITY_DN2334_c0_g1_i3.p1  ORF type:complete len:385 (-),score=55.20 TRINITY_DN2334_c0_g1_i3:705-1859(-)
MSSNFDRWEADPFFFAAEQVQDSADRLESTFRNWLYVRNAGVSEAPMFKTKEETTETLTRELQTALGTAKWQLDAFEKAVMSACAEKDSSAKGRHRHFVSAVSIKIREIENAMSDLCGEKNKGRLRWVQLNDEEKDDLALFLSRAEMNRSHASIDQCWKESDSLAGLDASETKASNNRADFETGCVSATNVNSLNEAILVDRDSKIARNVNGFKETILINRDSKIVVEMSDQKFLGSRYDCNFGTSTEKNFDSKVVANDGADLGSWKAVISGVHDEKSLAEPQHNGCVYQCNVWNLAQKFGLPGRFRYSKDGVKRAKDGGYFHRTTSQITTLGSGNKEVPGLGGSAQKKTQRCYLIFPYSRPIQLTWILLVMLCLVGLYTFITI